mgnify:FL=1
MNTLIVIDISGAKPKSLYVRKFKTHPVMNERACKQEFPFPCFRLDKSQKSPYFVHISELAVCINQLHETAKKDYATFHR